MRSDVGAPAKSSQLALGFDMAESVTTPPPDPTSSTKKRSCETMPSDSAVRSLAQELDQALAEGAEIFLPAGKPAALAPEEEPAIVEKPTKSVADKVAKTVKRRRKTHAGRARVSEASFVPPPLPEEPAPERPE